MRPVLFFIFLSYGFFFLIYLKSVSFFLEICYLFVMRFNFMSRFFVIFLFSLVFLSCASSPKEIPEELTAQELIQRGQDAFERKNYKTALRYYNAVTERYADSPPVYVEATYEIGHVFMKQKKYDKAETIFKDLLDLYEKAQPGTLPGAYRKLATLSLDKIPKKN